MFLLAVQAAAEMLVTFAVLRLNMLPDRYIILLCVAMAVLLLLTGGLLFLRGRKPVSLARRIVAVIILLVIAFGCIVGAKVACDANHLLHKVTDPQQDADENAVHVFVRADDPAQSLKDTAQYVFAVIAEYDEEATAEAFRLIQAQTGNTVAQTLYEDTAQLADALLKGDADAIVINGAAMILLSEEEGYLDLFDKIRVLHSFPVSQLEQTEPTTAPSTEPAKALTNSPFVVYLTGSDTRSKTLKRSRSDVNILAVVNPVTKQVLLLNTPRDYYVPNPVGKGKKDKLTNCGLYGPENSMEILGTLYGVQVDYYAQINFVGVETLVDAIGGITVTSTETFQCGEMREYQIVKGENYLDGKAALAFARERKRVSGGDNGRGKNQMRVITAIIRKMTSGTTVISNYSQIMASMEGTFRTSVPMEDISALVKMQLNDMATWNIQSFAVTGEGDSQKTYSAPGHRSYVMWPHEHMVEHASKLVQKVVNGEILTAEDMKAPKK